MKTILSVLLVVLYCLNTASANTYYFSTISGDDSRTSTEAQNPSTPWKTLSKLNSFFSSLQPGDFVLFKRGETFYGSITVNKSGTASAPIVISAYGTGSRPVITSLVTLSGWVANSSYSGVYESDANSAFDAEVNIVLLNGAQEPIGRYPNSDLSNKGYLTLESHVDNTSITDNQLASTPNWTGADVIIRTCRWTLDKSKITSHSGTKISYSSPEPYYEPRDNYGYFIQNHIGTLDQLGEWYYNPSTKKISMYFGGNNPSSYSVQAATNPNLAYSSGKSYIVFENITFKGANGHGMYIIGGTNNYVNSCDVLFSGIDGVKGSGTNFKLENSNILNSNNNGVNVASGIAPIVRSNIIKNSYTIAGMGQSGNGQGAGVRNGGKGLVEYNQIINSGFVGVQLGSDYAVVKNNLIDSFLFVKDDAAGIYTSNGENITNVGRKIIGNIILNAIGAGAGTPIKEGSTYVLSSSADGIYMDDNVNGVEITGNTVANCNRGIFLHNSRNIILKENTFYNHVNGQLFAKHDVLGDPLRNHTIINNVFFSKLATQIVASFTTKVDDIGSIGSLDSNYYARPMDDQITLYNHIYNLSPGQLINYRDLEGWRSKYGHDDVSKTSAKKIAPYKLKSLVGLNKYANGTFNSSAENIPQGKCVASWSNAGQLDGGYLKVVPSDEGSSVVISIGTLTAGKNYLLRYSVKGAGTLSLAANLRSASYTPNTPLIRRKVTTTRTENEILFSPVTNETKGALVFTADAATTYYLDNIQLYEATATITNPDDSIRFEYNASNSNKTVSLNGNYVDVKNNKYSNSIVLQPYESAILIKNGGVTIPANIAPTVSITDPVINESFTAPATINIEASASDSDGIVSKVEFYNDTTLLHTQNSGPYIFTWNNVPEGNYTFTAKATDNNGLVTTSAGIPVSVVPQNAAPTVKIIKPSGDVTYTGLTTISIEATADDADGTISKVEFYIGSTLLTTEKIIPYTYTWENVPAGNYTLTAKATDNSGNITTSSGIRISVVTQNAPTISIINPGNNTSFTGPATINMEATATDEDGTIRKVEFYNGTTLLVTENYPPFTYTWDSVPEGNYTLTAKAIDNDGNVTTSADVRVSVAMQDAPTVSIVNPGTNTSYIGPATINMEATANDGDGRISKVEFYNGSTLLHTEYYVPYTYTWSNVPLGIYTLTAKATDDNGNVTTSDSVQVSVVAENIAPSISIINPTNNASFTGPATINMEAIATDEDGRISRVEFYNGSTLLHTEYYVPYTYTWENVPGGNYTITAKAKDNNGKITTSAGMYVSVDVPPVVSIINPNNNASFTGSTTINMEAIASDANGTISKVEFYNGSALLKTEYISPYTYTWNDVPGGNYTFTATAYDNSGNVTTSAAVSVLVETPPTVSIIKPNNNASFTAPAIISMEAIATDAGGKISKVEFYNGTTLLHTEYQGTFTYTWKDVPAGSYTLTAKATDNSGNTTTSAAVTVLVENTVNLSIASPDHNELLSVSNDGNAIYSNQTRINNLDSPKLLDFRLFPNPAINKIHISFDDEIRGNQKANLSIQNLSGSILKSIPLILTGDKIEVDISSLGTGMYIICLSGDNFVVNKKFTKIN